MEKKTLQNNKKMEMEFGVRIATHSILKELNNGCHQKNLVISPLSLHICLNLLAAGAKGSTLDQLLRFLDSESVDQLNAQSSLFMELKKPSRGKGPIVSMVNGIWVDQHFSFKESFKHLADDIYRANSQSLDFEKDEQVAREINAWAKEESKGQIDNIISSDSLKLAVLVLANALCFRGSWLERFDPSNTEDDDFRLLNGKRVRVPFMKQEGAWSYYQSMNGFKILRMGYENSSKDKKKYAMHIFLPDRHDGLLELTQKFHSDPGLFTRNHKLQYVELDKLWLPKLKYDYELDMKENIKELGLDLPFQETAELTEMVDSEYNLYVSKAIQKSYIEVNEEGTFAASITKFELEEGDAPDTEEPIGINFVADHPFLFVVKEEISGIVLFVGAALNPLS